MNGEPDPAQPADQEAGLLAALGHALGADSPPAGLVDRARELLDLAHLDAELVELLDRTAAEPAGMRGATGTDRLEFASRDGSVALELELDRYRLVGQVLAGDPATVALVRPTGVVDTAIVDGLGRFSFDRVPPGPVRLRLLGGAGTPVTDWFLL